MIDLKKIYKSNNSGDFKIINYVNHKSVEVEFIQTGYRTITQAYRVKDGAVKDVLSISVYGVGFFGKGGYKANSKGKPTKQYNTWKNMLERCYCPKRLVKHQSYKDCTVCDEWHNFQNFAEWFDKNYIDGYHLDKDIKIDGNKVYSSEACIFVSRTDNNIKAQAKEYRLLSPLGIITEVYNLSKFCKENNLNQGNLAAVCRGEFNHHKGWSKV